MPATPPPALRLLILVISTMLAAGSAAPRSGRLAPVLFPLSAIVLAAVAAWTARRGSWGMARTFGGVGTGIMLGFVLWQSQIPAPRHYPPWIPARIEGVITNIREHPLRLQVLGEIDRQDLPPMRNTDVLVRISQVDSVRSALCVGNSVVIDAMARQPTPFHLPTEPNEATMLTSMAVTWSARARATDVHPCARTSLWLQWLGSARRATNDGIRAVMDTTVAPIAMALISGDRSAISWEQRAAYAAAGTAHMLSVSGSHVALILSIIVIALSRMRHQGMRLGIATVLICLYVVFTGAEPPAVRSAVMGIVAMSGRLFQRQIDGLNVWALTMLVMICVDPSMIASASFQLSAWATLGLIVLTPRLLEMCSRCTVRRMRWKRALAVTVCVTLAANAAIAIPAAVTFESVSLISPVVNLVVVPLMSSGMIFTLLALLCTFVAPVFAPMYGLCAEWCLLAADAITRSAALLRPDLGATSAIVVAAIICIGTWWVSSASSWKHCSVRSAVIVCVIALALCAPFPGTVRTISMFEREDCTVIVYPLPTGRTLVRIVGRRNDVAIRDIALHRFIATLSRPTVQRSTLHVRTRTHHGLQRSQSP